MFDLFNSFGKEEFLTDETSKQFHNAIFANGIFQIRKAPIGTFRVQVEKGDFTKYGLTQKCVEEFEFDHDTIPQIPVGILTEVIHLFREVSKTIKSEVYCAIIWNKVDKDFFIHVPEQTVAAASITYTNTPEIYNNPDLVVVMDIHSHVNMNAFFSGTDLKDEMGTRFYGVIGKVDSNPPEMVCRASTNGHSISLSFDQIFDLNTSTLKPDSDYTVPTTDYLKIKEEVYNKKYIGSTSYVDEDWWTEYQTKTGYGKGYSNTVSSSTRTSASTTTEVNPYTAIYTQLSTMRYGKTFNPEAVLKYLTTSIECAARYIEENNAPVTDIETLLQQVDSVMTTRLYSIIDQIDFDRSETEFSITQEKGNTQNDSSSI